MAWTKIGTTTLTSEGTSLGVTSLTDTKFIQVISHIFSGASGTATTNMHLNDVATGSEYASAYIANGGTYTPETTQNKLVYGSNTGASDNVLLMGYLLNIATEEKLFMCWTCDVTTTGAGQAPPRLVQVAKWDDSTNTVDEIDEDSTGDMGISSNLSVLGSDGVASLNVQDGAIYYSTDENKEFVLYNNAWTEL